jgi:hypothetical protein
VLKHPKTSVPQCLIAYTPRWSTQSFRIAAHANERHMYSKLTVTDWVSIKVTFSAEKSTSYDEVPEGTWPVIFGSAHHRSNMQNRAKNPFHVREHVALPFWQSSAMHTQFVARCAWVSGLLLQYKYSRTHVGHLEHPKQMCLSRVLRASTIFVTCCQVLKQLLWRLLDLRSFRTVS